jgi:hypothetical protein
MVNCRPATQPSLKALSVFAVVMPHRFKLGVFFRAKLRRKLCAQFRRAALMFINRLFSSVFRNMRQKYRFIHMLLSPGLCGHAPLVQLCLRVQILCLCYIVIISTLFIVGNANLYYIPAILINSDIYFANVIRT